MKIERMIIITNFRGRSTLPKGKRRPHRRYHRYGFPVLIWELAQINGKYVWLLSEDNINDKNHVDNWRAVNVDKMRNSIKNNSIKRIYKKLPPKFIKHTENYWILGKTYMPFSEKDLY